MGGNRGKRGQFALSTSASESGGLRVMHLHQSPAKHSPTILLHIKQEYKLIVHGLSYMLQSRRHVTFMLCSHETATDWIPAVIVVNDRFSSQSFAPR
jgi:hypothetical protein